MTAPRRAATLRLLAPRLLAAALLAAFAAAPAGAAPPTTIASFGHSAGTVNNPSGVAVNLTVRGWINYYGRFYPSELSRSLIRIDEYLVRWAMQKYKRLKGRRERAWEFLVGVTSREPKLFSHWRLTQASGRMVGAV